MKRLITLGTTLLGCAVLIASVATLPVFASETAAVEEADEAPVKKIRMIARNWEWVPNQIRVKQGTHVTLEFSSEDASHAFELKAYKIKVNLPQDRKGQVEFVADKLGEFTWRCSRPCGNGCAKMTGSLLVVE